MNDTDRFRGNRVIDLSRLNDSERRVLRLLGRGHTAKSIANELGTSAAAVNERLREARRKTDVSSSRELARLLTAQESRDERIGVGSGRATLPSLPAPDAQLWRPHTGVYAMIAMFLVAAAAAAALMSQAPEPGSSVDPLIGALPNGENAPDRLHARVRAEQRDPAWASAAEHILHERYSKIARVRGPNNGVRVICAATLCEVAGTIDAPYRPGHEYDRNDPLNKAMRELQDKPLHDDLLNSGLDGEGGMFGGSVGKPAKMTFLQYYVRKSSKPN